MNNIKKQFVGSFEGRFTTSPSDRVTPQITLTASSEVAEQLDSILISRGIIALKERSGENTILRIDLK